jgi:hypothetical protein
VVVTDSTIAQSFVDTVMGILNANADESGVCRLKRVADVRSAMGLPATDWKPISLALKALNAQGQIEWSKEIKLMRNVVHADLRVK